MTFFVIFGLHCALKRLHMALFGGREQKKVHALVAPLVARGLVSLLHGGRKEPELPCQVRPISVR